VTRHIAGLAVLSRIALIALAFVSSIHVDTAPVLTRVLSRVVALVHVEVAVWSVEAISACAAVAAA